MVYKEVILMKLGIKLLHLLIVYVVRDLEN